MKDLLPAPGPNTNIPNPHITIKELFGGETPRGSNADAELPLVIEDLRTMLREVILDEGKHLPA